MAEWPTNGTPDQNSDPLSEPGRSLDDAQHEKDVPPNPFEHQNFVRVAPSLAEIADQTETRVSPFRYLAVGNHISADDIRDINSHPEAAETTEGEGITDLLTFLDQVDDDAADSEFDQAKLDDLLDKDKNTRLYLGIDSFERPGHETPVKPWIHRKIEALKHTSFLGSQELNEAAGGLAQYWKTYLAEDPERQIYLVKPRDGKSGAFVQDRILEHFSEDELRDTTGRIVRSYEELTAEPDKIKVIFVDDWMMSGDQMSQHTQDAWSGGDFEDGLDAQDKYGDCMEINLLIADERRLQDGTSYTATRKTVPVKAYFKAPDATDSDEATGERGVDYFSRISGLHSSVDVHFSVTVSTIIAIMDEARVQQGEPDKTYTMPPLTNIVRSYRN